MPGIAGVAGLMRWATPSSAKNPLFCSGLDTMVHCSCLQTHQKKASDLITDSCEPPCGCWDLNSGPLEEQSVLLTIEPSLQLREWYY
ncbi:rCG56442 [Rattus norvegicus]|uniref:RCG56442 n=1 Tax=Rattus norvegicus TaxID=10116 RepID=A6IAV7_RAT|nr:rCG56442 [Rattus norvegicus]